MRIASILWLEDGRVSQLVDEALAGDHPWPADVSDFRVRWVPVNDGPTPWRFSSKTLLQASRV